MTATTGPPLRAFHGDPEIKAKYLARVEAHRRADELIQGYGYWKDGKGCAVGCTIHGDCHRDYEAELGIPEHLAWLEDTIFEDLPAEDAREWPERFLSAIHPGADLSGIFPRFAHWLLTSPEIGLAGHADDAGKTAIAGLGDLYRRKIAGNRPSDTEWLAAQAAAWSAWSAGGLAAGCATLFAVQSVAQSAIRSAVQSVARCAARSADQSDAWKAMANQLIVLLDSACVPEREEPSMEQTVVNPSPEPAETWLYALRSDRGTYLKRGSVWSIWETATPADIEAFGSLAGLRTWLAGRAGDFRRRLDWMGFAPVRLVIRVEAVAEAPEPWPVAVEIAAGYQ